MAFKKEEKKKESSLQGPPYASPIIFRHWSLALKVCVCKPPGHLFTASIFGVRLEENANEQSVKVEVVSLDRQYPGLARISFSVMPSWLEQLAPVGHSRHVVPLSDW